MTGAALSAKLNILNSNSLICLIFQQCDESRIWRWAKFVESSATWRERVLFIIIILISNYYYYFELLLLIRFIIIMKREGEILICRRACAPLIQFYCAKLTFKEQFKFAFLYRFWCRVWINGFRFRDWIKSTQWEVGFHFLSSINPSFMMKLLQDQRSLVLCRNSLSTEIVDQCFHPRPRAGCLRVPPAHPPRLRHQRAPSPEAQSARSQGVCIVHSFIIIREVLILTLSIFIAL